MTKPKSFASHKTVAEAAVPATVPASRQLTLHEELDYMECKLSTNIGRMARAIREMGEMHGRLRALRGDREPTVHHYPGAGEHGLGPGYYTDEDYELIQQG